MSSEASFYRSLLSADPANARVRATLAQTLFAAGAVEDALAEAAEALRADPTLIQARLVSAQARAALEDHEAAASDLEAILACHPERAAILLALAACHVELGRLDEAEALLRRATVLAPESAAAHLNLGSVLIKQERLAEAEAPCRAALALDPEFIAAHQNLSGILAATDPVAARRHRDTAYRQRQIFVEPSVRAARTVLVLAAADTANVPLKYLLPTSRNRVVRWYVEYATQDQDRELPPYDLVFNAIGEADLLPALPDSVVRLLHDQRDCVLNPIDAIRRTGRATLADRLADIPGVLVPATRRATGAACVDLPVLFRPTGAHGGAGVRMVTDATPLPAEAGYLTPFVDYVSADGWYRKYRAIFVDGEVFPYHLAISRQWMVHYWTSGMADDPARRDEERRFLRDPEGALGAPAMDALRTIAERLGLDYAGIDFGVLPDGRLVVFEANATMLVHPESDPAFAYRNPAFRAIQSAFDTMLDRRADAAQR